MSMAPLGGLLVSAAGAPLSQTKGGEVERTAREAAVSARALETADRADRAGGIGQTEQDQQSEERDADGRRPWEIAAASYTDEAAEASEPARSKDATGMAGTQLDLVG
jgi:hypothetical protein